MPVSPDLLTGFAPIVGDNPHTLILGSMPGSRSILQQQYYGHERNLFWPFMAEIFNVEIQLDYQQRTMLLKSQGIAVWDVLKHCERPGSLDSAIKRNSMVMNDFAGFFKQHKKISRVLLNGKTAGELFKKQVIKTLPEGQHLKLITLPSTSPANAAITREKKLNDWKIAIQSI